MTPRRPTASPPGPGVNTSSAHHRKDIQGLRAIAVGLVVAFHAGLPVPGGYVGVDVFFVISGFVITAMLLREREHHGRTSLAAFYTRRVRRILPALAVMVSVVAILTVLFLSPLGPQKVTASTGVAAASFAANMELYQNPVGYFDAPAGYNALLHTWSLSVEEQFYLLFPALVVAIFWSARRVRSPRLPLWLGLVLGFFTLLSFVASVLLTNQISTGALASTSSRIAFYWAPVRAWEFLVGALLASATTTSLTAVRAPVARTMGAVGLAAVLVSALAFDATTPFPGATALVPVAGTALLILAGTATRSGVSSLLATSPAVAIGDLSYSWYLWHWPVIVVARSIWPGLSIDAMAAIALLSLIPSWLSYHLVEHRFRAVREVTGGKTVTLAVICIVVPLLLCLSIPRLSELRQSPETKGLVAAYEPHADVTRGCDSLDRIETKMPNCVWSVPGSRGMVVLMGDSNAGHFTEPAAAAANASGYDFVADTSSGCGFVDVEIVEAGKVSGACRAHVLDALADLKARKPRLVFVALSARGVVGTDQRSFRDPVTGQVADTFDGKVQLLQAGEERILRQLTDADIPTALVPTIPQFSGWDPIMCGYSVYSDPASCGITLPRATMDAMRRPTFDAELRAAAAVPRATALDVTDDLCTPVDCRTTRDDTWIYRDGGHLSVAGALTLTGRFAAAIRAGATTTAP